jgi:TRAP-type C4-dicarboxylate transport system substrate-binding protein|tara:strand:- start:6918 stop:7997 length:1080 start_codon:yes stop_codon:yes gene_type:complete
MKFKSLVINGLAVAAATVAFTMPASATKTLNLTGISGYPPAATWIGAFVDVYMPSVNAELAKTGNYTINWNKGVSGTIVKPRGELDGIGSGLGDLGVVVTAFHADKVPLYDVAFKTPFTTMDLGLAVATTGKMESMFDAYGKTWDSFNQVNLGPSGAVDNYMLWSKTKITKLSDIKGRKVGAAGPNLPWVIAAGAAGVQTNLADAYNSLSTGIYDAMIVWRQAAGAFKLCEPAPFVIDASLGAVNGFSLNVNKDVWAGLPGEVKNALKAAIPAWQKESVGRVNKGAAGGLARCKKDFGTEYTKMSDSDIKAWSAMLPPLARNWAAAQDKKGLPGTPILKAWMDEMRAKNQPVMRDWDVK